MSVKEELLNLLCEGVALHPHGIHNWALNAWQSINFVEIARQRKVPILGGDLYFVKNGEPVIAYENWFCGKNEKENHDDYVDRSANIAKDFININLSKLGENILFALIVDCDLTKTDSNLDLLKQYWSRLES